MRPGRAPAQERGLFCRQTNGYLSQRQNTLKAGNPPEYSS